MRDSGELSAANATLLDLAHERLHALRMLEIDAIDMASQGRLATAKLGDETERVGRAVETLSREIGIREELGRTLREPEDPARSAAVSSLLDQIHALRARQRDAFYRGDAKVADPCIPCLQKAFLDAEIKRLKKLPGMTRARLKKAVKRIKKEIMQADPEVLRQINDQLGTRVNFGALARFEGGQWTRGYVPPAGKSGVTIGTGFDVGQWQKRALRAQLGLPESVAERLDPYTGLIRGDAAAKLRRMPLEVTRDEANLIDQGVHRYFVRQTMDAWDSHRPAGTPAYRELSSAQQTVLFSRTFHQGPGMPRTGVARDFYQAAQRNDWAAAESHLRHYRVPQRWYVERVTSEADLLRSERGAR